MDPVLIFTDSISITAEQNTLANLIPIYQAIYTAVKAAGVTAITLPEIESLVQNAKRQNPSNFVNDYVLNKLVATVSPFVVNGVTLTTNAVKGMIAMPDTSAITAALQPVWGNNAQFIFKSPANGARLNLLGITNDVISAVEDANTQIAAIYTYYTASDASATVATQLQAVCDALNTFSTANGNIYLKAIQIIGRDAASNIITEIPGIAQNGSEFIICLKDIRKFEQTGSMNFAR